MKAIKSLLSPWMKVLVYFLILWSATAVAGTVPMLNDFLFFFLVALFLSWVFLKAENSTLSSLGFWPKDRTAARNFLKGLGIGIAMLLVTFVLTVWLTQDGWKISTHVDPVFIVITFLGCLWSAFVQEFIFRGYPFQELLRNYRVWIAQLLIALPFGLMHVSRGMPAEQITMVMFSTGTGSVLFGLAFIKSGDLMFPIGLHLGWNYAQELIPRTAGGQINALVVFKESHKDYNAFLLLLPYFFVMIVTIILIRKFPFPRR
ncbi:CPBP family intramembrane glutamic endopeptidase [Taibaiella helva]|uniref:CPBP family intramembrane glutamic endopeptidase n=1 Tax=Taibaiella helva TaxID=2301235 RepID=UPI000E5824BA|nr:type II CAAX endopeptidase family protein [Taibaiella helva]